MEVYPTSVRELLAWKSNYEITNAENSHFPIFGEPRYRTLSLAPEEADVYGVTVREPPAWKLNYKIGNGTSGTVFLEKVQTRVMESPELWAVKRISKAVRNFPVRRYHEEIKNLQALSKYVWFVKFNSSYEDDHFLYIAMEYIPIGNMSKTFVDGYRWNESDTKVVIKQLHQGLAVMHEGGIIHSDLKPENIFLCLPGNKTHIRIKIGNFGTSTSIPMPNTITYLATSTGYMGPEVDDRFTPKTNRVDIWSLGCILYRMVTGSLLFNSRYEVSKYADTASSPPLAVKNKGFSVACEDFLRGVLQASPEDRPSAEGCLKARWLMNGDLGSEDCIGSDIYRRLSRIELVAPDIDSFSHTVTDGEAHGAPAGAWSTLDSGDRQAIFTDKSLAPPAKVMEVYGYPLRLPPELGDLPLHSEKDGWYSVLGSWNHTIDNSKQANRVSEGSSENSLLIPVSAMNPPRNIPDGHTKEPPAWRLDCKIGTGAFGTVFLEKAQTHRMHSPELWAVKRISRALPNFPSKQSQAEIKNLQVLSKHGWFVKFYSSYEDADYMYIAMEYIPIGDMSKTFINDYRWNESDTKVVIRQLLHGLAVMHNEGITHRDLKPENIFLSLPEDETQVLHVKIGDFGTSKHIPLFNASTYLKTTTGTLGYMAPEMLDTSKPKTNRVDIWSLGCVLYRMFAGSPLFKDPFEVYQYVMTKPTPSLALEDRGLSLTCVKFLRDVLQPAPEDRPSAEACLKNVWVVNDVPGYEYSIGKDLYAKLFKIKQEAPNMDNF